MTPRFNWTNLWRRISTWLALVSLSATGGLGAYAIMPERAQHTFPDWLLMALGALAVGSACLIPVATSFKQPGMSAGCSDGKGEP